MAGREWVPSHLPKKAFQRRGLSPPDWQNSEILKAYDKPVMSCHKPVSTRSRDYLSLNVFVPRLWR